MVKEKHESLYESLFNNNRDAVIFFNETTIVDANKSALDLFEVNRDEFIGHEIYEFTLDKEKANKRAERRQRGVSESFTTEISTPKGVKELEISSTAVNIENITSYSIIRDITERKTLEQRFRVIFQHSRDLIFITSKESVEFINPCGVKYLEYSSPTEIIGKHPTELIHPDSRELATRHATMRRSGGTPPHQYRAKMITKKGKTKPVEFNASYIKWDGKPASLTIARDISKQVELEEELTHSRQILIDFTESATDAFSILDEDLRFIMVNETELEYSGLEKEDYIGKHMLELFPDLTDTDRYTGYQRVLETGEPVHYPDTTSRNGEHIINYTAFKAGDYLGIVGRDVTEQQRLDDGRMSIAFETFNLTRVVSYVMDELSGVISEKNQIIEVNMSDKVVVEGDMLRLEQVLVNLVHNASKYSPEGSVIWLSAKVSDGMVQISIRDEGIGLTEEDVEKLFMPFPDIERPTVTEQSVGLGLSICKGVIDLHGGKIWAESSGRDEGSTFIFTLPRRERR